MYQAARSTRGMAANGPVQEKIQLPPAVFPPAGFDDDCRFLHEAEACRTGAAAIHSLNGRRSGSSVRIATKAEVSTTH